MMVTLVEKTAELSRFVGSGELSPGELLDTYTTFLDSSPTPLALVDLTQASLQRISGESMRLLARRVTELGKGCRPRGKTAIVCGREVDFGMARMFATLASIEGHPVRFAAFLTLHSAKAWLAGEGVDPSEESVAPSHTK
jgi:hypothetical protein